MVDITNLTTLKTPTQAESVIKLTSPDQLTALHTQGVFKKPFLFLGMGANILFTHDFPGTIIKNNFDGHTVSKETSEEVFITSNSGQSWIDLVEYTTEKGWSGMENMALIPGTVGAAVVGNIAAYGQNQEDFFDSLTAINLTTGNLETFSKPDCHFGYRESIFKHELKNKYFISTITYRLSRIPKFNFSYNDVRKKDSILSELDTFTKPPYVPADITRAVTQIRTRKLPDWDQIGTAGSFFKNPMVSRELAEKLQQIIPELQIYPVEKLSYNQVSESENMVKLPAGRLIDQLGWKGKKIGNVGTAENQALCIINYGGATGQEIFDFSESIRDDVLNNYNIDLEYEVIIV